MASASEMLDPVSQVIASPLGISASEFSETYGIEGLALLLQVPAGFIFPTLGQTLVYLTASLGLLAAHTMVPSLKGGRSGHDALELSSHFGNTTAAILANPVTAALLAADVANLKAGLAVGGNLDLVRQALIRNPTDIQTLINQLITAYQQIVAPAGIAGFRGVAPAVVRASVAPAGSANIGGTNVIGISVPQVAGPQGAIF